jgi:NOL1/NOP2/fmu family ribosome biogenesis protein
MTITLPLHKTRLHVLNSREVKPIKKVIIEQWGIAKNTLDKALDYVFFMNQRNKIFIVTREVERLKEKKLAVTNLGSYFGELMHNGEVRLSIEGSQILGKLAKQNVLELNKDQARLWMKGQPLQLTLQSQDLPTPDHTLNRPSQTTQSKNRYDQVSGFQIIKYGKDYMCCGKVKEGILLNFMPKNRRILAKD